MKHKRAPNNVGALGFSQTSAMVRLVCSQWQAAHDAVVSRLGCWWAGTI
jgi:hypothetical protein